MSMPDAEQDARRRGGLARVGLRLLLASALLIAGSHPAQAQSAGAPASNSAHWLPAGSAPALGVDATADPPPAALIYPDGTGLPPGSGLAAEGGVLYQAQCASCHGSRGEGRTAPELIGGSAPLNSPEADKTVASYWPYATTLFDTIQRSMPPAAPGRLSAGQIYALCAWVLAGNGLWPATRPLDAAGLAALRMPNRDGFIAAFPPEP